MSEAEPGKVVPIQSPSNGDASSCPVCEYRGGPFTSAKAAAEDYLKHLESKHCRMMAGCECGWKSGPHPGKLEGLAALVAHAAEAHGILVRAPGPPQWNEAFARARVDQLLGTAKRIEEAMKGSPIVGPDGGSKRDLDLNLEIVSFIHKASMSLASVLDMMLTARTGRPALEQLKPDAVPPKSP